MSVNRIAVASSDSIHVDSHFGKADRFLIFDMTDMGPALREIRPATRLSVDDPGHSFDANRFEQVFAVIKDCEKIFVAQIGDTPAAQLRVRGVEPVVFTGLIADIQP